jgi:3-hexulose-6-phosphate synthase
MLLQLALDALSREKAHHLVGRLSGMVDIIEVGTPLLLRYGLKIVSEIKNLGGGKPVFVDAKIVDAGRYETEMVLEGGASMVSVLAGASLKTLHEAREACRRGKAKLVVDTIDLETPSPSKIRELRAIDPDYVVLHLPSDLAQEGKSWKTFLESSPFLAEPFAFMVAGGLRKELLPEVLSFLQPQIVVVGSAVTASPTPEEELRLFREVLHGFYRKP